MANKLRLYNDSWGRAVVAVLRVVVGAVFIFSGFTKGIDPWGSVYKFDEYLHSFGMAGYEGLLAFMAFSLSAIEFVLGAFMVVGAYRRFTPIVMLLMMTVMLPLTLYIAITGEVADCGCFGDAVTLSNWGTFWKNVALTAALAYLAAYNTRIRGLYGPAVQWIVALLSAAFILLVAWEGYFVQPLLDFRPYPVGTTIAPDDLHDGADVEYLFVYEKDGVQQKFAIDQLPDDTWAYVDREPVEPADAPAGNADSYRPVTVYDTDYLEAHGAIVAEGDQLLLLFPSLTDVVISYTYLINEAYDFCQERDIDVVGLTSETPAEIEEWNDLSMAAYPMYIADDSTLKMIARGNPAAVLLRHGRIVWKRSLQSIPLELLSQASDLDQLIGPVEPRRHLYFLSGVYVAAMLLVLIVNRTHLLVKISMRRARKSQKKQVNLQPEDNE